MSLWIAFQRFATPGSRFCAFLVCVAVMKKRDIKFLYRPQRVLSVRKHDASFFNLALILLKTLWEYWPEAKTIVAKDIKLLDAISCTRMRMSGKMWCRRYLALYCEIRSSLLLVEQAS
jgi:hypothetical protein